MKGTTEKFWFFGQGCMNGLIYNVVNSWLQTWRHLIQLMCHLCFWDCLVLPVQEKFQSYHHRHWTETEVFAGCVAAPCHSFPCSIYSQAFMFSTCPHISNSDEGHLPFLLKLILYLPPLWASENLPHSLQTHSECLRDAPHNPSSKAFFSCHPFRSLH